MLDVEMRWRRCGDEVEKRTKRAEGGRLYLSEWLNGGLFMGIDV